MITIYHNPRCSKSRAALELVQQFGQRNQLAVNVVEYLKTPLNAKQLTELQAQLGMQVGELVREHGELSAAQQRAILIAQPELLQRPIVCYQGRAVIGRPTEVVAQLLGE